MAVVIVVALLIALVVYMGLLAQKRDRAAAALANYNGGRRPDDPKKKIPPVKAINIPLDLTLAKDGPPEILLTEFFAAGPPAYLCGLLPEKNEYVTLRVDRILKATELNSDQKIPDLARYLAKLIEQMANGKPLPETRATRRSAPATPGAADRPTGTPSSSAAKPTPPVEPPPLTAAEIAQLNLKTPMYVIYDEPMPLSSLDRWQHGDTKYTRVIGHTAFGEIFLQDPVNSRYAVLDPQQADVRPTTVYDETSFRTTFLTDPVVLDIYMRPRDIAVLEKRLGPLLPDEVYIPVPYLCLGGDGNLQTYEKGDRQVYLDIVAQTHGL